MGIHRSFPGRVTVLSTCFLGLGIPDQYAECAIAQIVMFVNNMRLEALTMAFLTCTLQLL